MGTVIITDSPQLFVDNNDSDNELITRADIKYKQLNCQNNGSDVLGTFVDSLFDLLHQRFDPWSVGAKFTVE